MADLFNIYLTFTFRHLIILELIVFLRRFFLERERQVSQLISATLLLIFLKKRPFVKEPNASNHKNLYPWNSFSREFSRCFYYKIIQIEVGT